VTVVKMKPRSGLFNSSF